MRIPRHVALIGLICLLVVTVIGFVLTSPPAGRLGAPETGQRSSVDQAPLDVARRLAPLAENGEERQLAQNALRIADHEVDLAFEMALRAAAEPVVSPLSPEAAALQKRVAELRAEIKASQEGLKQLTAQAQSAGDAERQQLNTQIEVARAELALDQDELADATEDLGRAGGDARSTIQRLLAEHEAAQHQNGAPAPAAGTPSSFSSWSVAAKWARWTTLGYQRRQLDEAQRLSSDTADPLAARHDELQSQTQRERAPRGSAPSSAERIASLGRLSLDEKNLADLDKRIEDLRQLAAIYGRWSGLVRDRQREALHDLIGPWLLIVVAVLGAFLCDRWIERLFERISLERKQRLTLRSVGRFAVRALAAVAVVLILFGSPYQLLTVVGLVGAGLTLALKDFIVSFLGWFVLMGRRGIRVGDWVEINGVRGEVAEISLWRTVLLENSADGSRPTGRQVTFLNSFAIEGLYFNFSTSGQWLWDELIVTIPGENPYPLVEAVQTLLENETRDNARLAEQEWEKVAHRYGARSLSAAPEISLRSTLHGVEAILRYVTRAPERAQVRSRLNHAVVTLFRQSAGVARASSG